LVAAAAKATEQKDTTSERMNSLPRISASNDTGVWSDLVL
jgi:hypothetical protein